jgi:hypothetical protein
MSGTRSRTGCMACRRRKKRCDEMRPICRRCQVSGVSCVYPNASGAFSERYLISSALEHYMLPDSPSERHFINLGLKDISRLCLTYDSSADCISSFDILAGREVPKALPAADVLVDVSERQLLQYCKAN